ncbi:hypothetical protein MRX96_053158 [Rhipicephalus microplus]
MGGAVAVGSGAGPAVSIISAPSNALEDGEADAGAAPVPTELVCTTSAAASAIGVATDWAARGNPGGAGAGPSPTRGREPIGRSLTKAPMATVYGFSPSPINTSPRLGTAYVGSSGSAVSPLTVT